MIKAALNTRGVLADHLVHGVEVEGVRHMVVEQEEQTQEENQVHQYYYLLFQLLQTLVRIYLYCLSKYRNILQEKTVAINNKPKGRGAMSPLTRGRCGGDEGGCRDNDNGGSC